MSKSTRYRKDGSLRAADGVKKINAIRGVLDQIDGANLSRQDTLRLKVVYELVAKVANYQWWRGQNLEDQEHSLGSDSTTRRF